MDYEYKCIPMAEYKLLLAAVATVAYLDNLFNLNVTLTPEEKTEIEAFIIRAHEAEGL